MGYSLNFEEISLEELKSDLVNRDLVPSRAIIKQGINRNFDLLKKQGIQTVQDLMVSMKTKIKLAEMAKVTGIEEMYLTLLLREIKSDISKPNKFSNFKNLTIESIQKLESSGMKNTRQVYEKILAKNDREKLAKELKISTKEMQTIAQLTDLSRIKWVNHTFADVLYELGYLTSEDVSGADAETLYHEVNDLVQAQQLYRGKIGIRDIHRVIQAAGRIPFEMDL